ncbi:FMN-binding protein MioC [Pseudoalteromonas denitrificans]|uniref:MioC protein n=1 Tax=Pseudoalteromonas denitrificans DSM 6059 TaxID=1123010 RepID=A0A1I1JU53_9GAMM|nr:FMN-binding protein MioC [Pseudoalteromonas denitrificans]SFC49353.1 MioC protein [Pseudoalteromonas denitrificans DSM 6059]
MTEKIIHIIVGSQMGSSEYVADQLNGILQSKGYSCQLHEQPNLEQIPISDVIWLICTSTHGAGELPDNLQLLIKQINNHSQLKSLSYTVIGLGDTSYDTYNKAAKDVDLLLKTKQANQIMEVLEIDAMDENLPEDIAIAWLPNWLSSISQKNL